jgi:hypothetical protein
LIKLFYFSSGKKLLGDAWKEGLKLIYFSSGKKLLSDAWKDVIVQHGVMVDRLQGHSVPGRDAIIDCCKTRSQHRGGLGGPLRSNVPNAQVSAEE